MKNKIENITKIGIIGGSGLYQIEGIKYIEEIKIKTPFGDPSDNIIVGAITDTVNNTVIKIAFLPRHGKGHRILPSEINYLANIYALKQIGVEQIISISACGSLKEEIHPCDFVIPDQIFDRTRCRKNSFFGNGIVGHIGFANPFCSNISKLIYEESVKLGIKTHFGGTYVCIEGPQFSTKIESEVNRKLGFSIVGMTASPEAKLAREAEICYAMIGLVTDYDVWKEGEEVSVDKIVDNLNRNIDNVKKIIKNVIPHLGKERTCECASSLKYAIFTQKEYMDKKTLKKLNILISKYIK
jgi:5'-methylthioadenosine phosphorylase